MAESNFPPQLKVYLTVVQAVEKNFLLFSQNAQLWCHPSHYLLWHDVTTTPNSCHSCL